VTEPDVTLTDYGLAAECALFAWLLGRRAGGDPGQGARWTLFFVAGAVAAAAGGTVHGFFLDPATAGARLLWPLTLIAVGGSALAAWAIGARLLLAPAGARALEGVAAAAWVAYAGAVLGGAQAFAVALAAYLPATLFLSVAVAARYRQTREPALLAGLLGLGGTLAAAAVQHGRVAVHPVYFNHNALYHVIQAGAFLLLFAAARRLTGGPSLRRTRWTAERGTGPRPEQP
jgi:hypothetical protein